jgi:hypothetical protein
MKHYLMESKNKKACAEYDVFQKEIDGVTYRVVREEVYRWGYWVVNVPSTDDEIKEWLDNRGETMEDMIDCYESVDEFPFMPDLTDDCIELEDYDTEFLEMWDGCSTDWYLQDPAGNIPEDKSEEIIELVMDIFEEEYHEGLEDEGWENVDCFQQIHSEVTLKECDELGHVSDEDIFA